MTVVDLKIFTNDQINYIMEAAERRDSVNVEYFSDYVNDQKFDLEPKDLDGIIIGLNQILSENAEDKNKIMDCIDKLKRLQENSKKSNLYSD